MAEQGAENMMSFYLWHKYVSALWAEWIPEKIARFKTSKKNPGPVIPAITGEVTKKSLYGMYYK